MNQCDFLAGLRLQLSGFPRGKILFLTSGPKTQVYKNTFPYSFAAAAAKSLQSCSTLCDPIDGSPPGSPVPGILKGRTLEWVAISFSREWKWKVKVKSLSHVWLPVTPWTVAHEAPPSMGFPRQEYWNGVPLPSPFHPSSISLFKNCPYLSSLSPLKVL